MSGKSLLVKRNKSEAHESYPRAKVPCRQQDTQFNLKQTDFKDQYFSVYCKRLNTLRPKVEETAKKLWIENIVDPPVLLHKSIDIKPAQSAILIGTLIKELTLLPTILEQYTKERAIVPIPKENSFENEKDKIWIEDDSGRILLKPGPYSVNCTATWADLPFDVRKYSHGSVLGVKGVELEGAIYVEDFCVAGAPPQPEGPTLPNSEDPISCENGRFVILTSGISGASPLQTQMMLNYIQGHLGCENEQKDLVKQIVRVIIAGNLFPQQEIQEKEFLRKKLKSRQNESMEKLQYINLLRDLDIDLAHLACSVPVDIMPGEIDPTNFTLPHQPLNGCLFPLSSKFSSFHRVTTPHLCSIDDTVILGTSGEEITNLQQFITVKDPVEIVEQLIGLRHIAPTAPNTLPAYPSEEHDPFVLDVCPHVYFVGNQEEYQTRLFIGDEGQHTRIVSVPDFSKTHTVVLLNIDNLSCFPITFSSDL